MTTRSVLRRTALWMLALSCFAAGTAQAATQAVIKIEYQAFCCAFLGAGSPAIVYRNDGTGTATVGTGPTPTIMFPSGIISDMALEYQGGWINFTPNGAIALTPNGAEDRIPSPFMAGYYNFVGLENVYNMNATLQASNPLVPTVGTTFGWNATTSLSKCNGLCLPRYGTLFQAPGSKQFGGTARLIDWGTDTGLKENIDKGGFTQQYFNFVSTPMLLGTPFIGRYGNQGSIQITTVFGANIASYVIRAGGVYTTGNAKATFDFAGNPYPTTVSLNGSHAFNGTNLTGMISLVKPSLSQSFAAINGTILGNGAANNAGNIFIAKLTFLPEPSYVALLGVGCVGLAALYRRRS